MQKYDFTAPASGAPQVVNAPGRYIKYITGNAGGNDASLIVTPGGKPGSKIILYPGQAVTLPHDAPMPNSWTIANALGAGAITGTVVVGNGKMDDNTLQGVVNVVDGGKARTLSGNAFAGYGSVAGVAAQYSRVQLWNPASNPNRVVVENITLLANGGSLAAVIQFNNAALAAQSQFGVSKKSGGAVSAASINTDTTATVITPVGPLIGMAESTPSTQGFKLAEPIVLTPGYGLLMYASTINTTMGASFEWYEEPNV